MTTMLHTLVKALRSILRGLAQTPYMRLCGPIPWPGELDREASARDPR
jgi:hypothetical protein